MQAATNNVEQDTNKKSTRENPMEYTYALTTKTLAFEQHFGTASFDNDEFPLELYNSFSRISGVLIENGIPALFNIPKRDLPLLFKKSDYAISKHLDELYFSDTTDNEASSSAYTVRFTSGKLKGKTPAEVLLEDINNKALLNSHYKFLAENCTKFPKNKEQMDAIIEASKLLEAGTLSADSVKKSVTIPIYAPGFRPKIRKTREDGKAFVYDIKITCNVGSDNPIVLTVNNFYAPVERTDKGLLNVIASKKDTSTEIKNTISLPLEMWENIVYDTKAQMNAFEVCNFTSAYKNAITQETANRNALANR